MRKHRTFAFVATLFSLSLLAGCSSTDEAGAENTGKRADPSGPESEVDSDDPANQPPHSLGTIILGESHVEGESARPFVSASFIPDARAAKSCKEKIAKVCEIVRTPKCDDRCDSGEVCAFDDDCAPTCKKVAVCSKECDEDEACTLDKAGKATCAKIESFDAGPLAFSGTTTSLTLYPPYAYEGGGDGAPFLAGAKITVQAQGATGAGFEAFEETFSATTFIQTKLKSSKLSLGDVFGNGDVPVSWVPGKDAIVVSVSGLGGTVTCKADDAAGSFEIPRAAIDAVIGETSYGGPTLALSIARQRKETKKGLKSGGELATSDVEPEGWLDLITTSTETVSLQGCSDGEAACGSECVDPKTDPENCGTCGKACAGGATCNAGKCGVLDACGQCQQNAVAGYCAPEWSDCLADSKCAPIGTCMSDCGNATCRSQCVNSVANPSFAAMSLYECLVDECSGICK